MFGPFEYTSFFSVWYWVLTVTVWTQVCHRTLGVPYDMILRAGRLPEGAADVEAMTRIAAARITAIHNAAGTLLAGLLGFVLAALAVFGFVSGIEPARAGFILVLPLSVVLLCTVRLALYIDRTGVTGAELRRRLARRRAWNQAIAITATLLAAFIALLHQPVSLYMRL